MSRSALLSGNRWLAADHRFGLRASGLIMYGALPASLGALGAFKPPEQGRLFTAGLSVPVLIGLAVVAAVPILITFVLVRQRLARWYLFADWLALRSALITLAIIMLSTAVCLATGGLTGAYEFVGLTEWWALPQAAKARPLIEGFLLSAAYLVGSNTLFLAVIKEDAGLPFLPAKDEVAGLDTLRAKLRQVINDKLHSAQPPKGAVPEATQLRSTIADAASAATALRVISGSWGRAILYDRLTRALHQADSAVEEVGESATFWPRYWGADDPGASAQVRERRGAIAELRSLRVNG